MPGDIQHRHCVRNTFTVCKTGTGSEPAFVIENGGSGPSLGCAGVLQAQNTAIVGGRVFIFDRGAGPVIQWCCDFGLSGVTHAGGITIVNYLVPVQCAIIKISPWCPGQYNEGIGCADLFGLPFQAAPAVLTGNVLRTLPPTSPNCSIEFSVKWAMTILGGPTVLYDVQPPVEANPAQDIVFDFEVLGCPCTFVE